MNALKNYDGKRCGIATVIRRSHKDESGTYWHLLKCDCGKLFYARTNHLHRIRSCGCRMRQNISEAKRTHGCTKTRLYAVWLSMKKRCYYEKNISYPNYGGRCIKICEEWLSSFEAFKVWACANGYDENKSRFDCSIDRIDANGDYCPENCRWVNSKVQANNKRSSHFLSYNGETHTISEWSKITNIGYHAIWRRIKNGWDVKRALTQSVQVHKRRDGE